MRKRAFDKKKNSFGAFAGTLLLSAITVMLLSGQPSAFTTNQNYPAAGQLTAGKQVTQVYTFGGNTWVYLCYLPYGYDSQPNRKWPMVFWQPCMSGTDGGGGGFTNMLGGNNCSGISGYMQTPEKYHFISDSFIVVTPWQYWPNYHTCHPATEIDPNYKAYYPALFSHLFSSVRADSNRVHMIGACLGAAFIYKMVSFFPNIPASLTLWELNDPTNGCSDTTKVGQFKNIAMKVIHGEKDYYSPWQHAKSLVDLIIKAGNTRCEWFLSMGAPHETWMWGDHTDKDTTLYTWMLAQRKTQLATSVNPVNRDGAIKGLTTVGQGGASISGSDRVEILDLRGQILSKGNKSTINQTRSQLSGGIRLVRITRGNESVVRMAVTK